MQPHVSVDTGQRADIARRTLRTSLVASFLSIMCCWILMTMLIFSLSAQTSEKLFPTMVRGIAMKMTPAMMASDVMALPVCEFGLTSP